MYSGKPLNIFYNEPDPDRWLPFDRYPRKIIRQIIRGKERVGGVGMIAISLMRGLDKLGIPYRYNDYRYIEKHPQEIACIIGKPHVLFEKKWANPVIFGAGVYSHPIDYPDLFSRYPNVKRILVPGDWIYDMFKPYYGDNVLKWPAGIDAEKWSPGNKTVKYDFLIYDKILFDYEGFNNEVFKPLKEKLKKAGLSFQSISYGNYTHDILKDKLLESRAVIFLCRSETQGFAYQQILSTNTPILAWDEGGYWKDPDYYPHRVKYEPVSSVPYWDERCGIKFTSINDFEENLKAFMEKIHDFRPRAYILENLTLEKCAQKYLDIFQEVEKELM